MSSYLNFYLINKKTKEKELLDSYSRSTEVYQTVWKEASPSEDGMEITETILGKCLHELREEIDKTKHRIDIMKTVPCKDNQDVVSELLEWEEYISDKQDALDTLSFYSSVLDTSKIGANDFSGIYITID